MEPRTNVQAKEWGTIWPVQTFHVKEGTMQDKPRGWERAKRDWIKRESEKCWKAAVESGRRGEVSLYFRFSFVHDLWIFDFRLL